MNEQLEFPGKTVAPDDLEIIQHPEIKFLYKI
jgi:hypothetical protein